MLCVTKDHFSQIVFMFFTLITTSWNKRKNKNAFFQGNYETNFFLTYHSVEPGQ